MARLTKKRESPNKINERGEISTDTTGVCVCGGVRNIKEHYDQLYGNKFNNLEEMDNFLEIYGPPKLTQEETDNVNRLIAMIEVKSINYTTYN